MHRLRCSKWIIFLKVSDNPINMRIAITGGIGSGKSYVCQRLKERGIVVYDCDAGAKRLMGSSEDIRNGLISLIGDDAYDGWTLNKPVVTRFLLESESNKLAINAIVHPAVIRDFYDSGLQWMESAILYEAHLEHTVDRVVCVVAPEDVRIDRVVKRDSVSRERAKQWIDAQISQEDVAQRADAVIVNDGVKSVDEQLDKVLALFGIEC